MRVVWWVNRVSGVTSPTYPSWSFTLPSARLLSPATFLNLHFE